MRTITTKTGSRLIAACAVLACMWSALASAQDGNYIDAVTPYAHSQLHRYRGDDDADTPAKASTARAFEPSAEVSRAVNRALSDMLVGDTQGARIAESENLTAIFVQYPAYRALLARQIGGDARSIRRNLDVGILQSTMTDILDRRGYSAHDPVEVMNAYLVTAWRVAHDDRQNAHDQAYRGLQRAMRNSDIELPPEPRQQISEMFGIVNMLTLAAWRSTRDPDEREALRTGTLALAQRVSGVDMQTVVLTDRGFARRD